MVTEDIRLSKRRYNIQEVADILGIYKGTVKNYENKGIFPKARRNPINKYREYTPQDIDILKRILLKGK
ncbi:MAG: MerR family transcriptional regulator [Candidatus Omnitrophota bacterium]|nr:MAG: MerR family transcriptional regulator [Candidatus Omnitrophota bacterium]